MALARIVGGYVMDFGWIRTGAGIRVWIRIQAGFGYAGGSACSAFVSPGLL